MFSLKNIQKNHNLHENIILCFYGFLVSNGGLKESSCHHGIITITACWLCIWATAVHFSGLPAPSSPAYTFLYIQSLGIFTLSADLESSSYSHHVRNSLPVWVMIKLTPNTDRDWTWPSSSVGTPIQADRIVYITVELQPPVCFCYRLEPGKVFKRSWW